MGIFCEAIPLGRKDVVQPRRRPPVLADRASINSWSRMRLQVSCVRDMIVGIEDLPTGSLAFLVLVGDLALYRLWKPPRAELHILPERKI